MSSFEFLDRDDRSLASMSRFITRPTSAACFSERGAGDGSESRFIFRCEAIQRIQTNARCSREGEDRLEGKDRRMRKAD